MPLYDYYSPALSNQPPTHRPAEGPKSAMSRELQRLAILAVLILLPLNLCYTCQSSSAVQNTDLGLIDAEQSDSYRAIKTLHSKLDVDADGEVNDLESKTFLESDQRNNHNNAHKLSYLHQDGKDRSITVDELWFSWTNSEVHNWTTDETVYWLINYVELPEYSHLFEQNSINGTLLPRLATDISYISRLGITDPSAKSRISIKAMDVVLFGPPKVNQSNRFRDIIVSIIVIATLSLCLLFYSKSRASESRLEEMKNNLCTLQKSAEQLQDLQKELDKAVKAQEAVATEKKNLEHQLEEKWSGRAPVELKSLLQATYDIESQHLNEKKQNLEHKATEVKIRNQKLQKKKASLLGYYKMAQENSLEEDINTIQEVKEAIKQVTQEIRERAERWRAIEQICGCSLEHK